MDRLFTVILLFLSVASSLGLSGCGKDFERISPSGFTQVTFAGGHPQSLNLMDEIMAVGQPGQISTRSIPGADMMIFASNMGENRGRLYVSNATANAGTATWTIPNGAYFFGMVGYPTAQMLGTPVCAGANAGAPLTLDGTAASITLTGGACSAASMFKGSINYEVIDIAICTGATSIMTATAPTDTCTSLSGGASLITGVRVAYTGGDNFEGGPGSALSPDVSNQIISACLSVTSGLSITAPVLGGNNSLGLVLRTEVFTYTGANCATLAHTYTFLRGLASVADSARTIPMISIDNVMETGDLRAKWVESGTAARLLIK